jgi:hypothetical protein
MGFFNKEVELIIPPKKQTVKNDKQFARGSCAPPKSLNGYDAIREKIDEGARDSYASPLSVKAPVEQNTKPKTKVSIGL